MRKLILLIRKYWNLILFIILQVICINLIAKQNSVQSVDIINSSNAIVGFVYKTQNTILNYFRMGSLNKELLAENAQLRNMLARDANIDSFQDLIHTIPIRAIDSQKYTRPVSENVKPVNDSTKADTSLKKIGNVQIIRYASYHYIPARVINNSISNDRMNYITLNRGSKDGITKNLAVVTNNGIVGRVVNVSKNYATVISLLSEGRKYSTRLEDGSEYFISWDKGSSSTVLIDNVPKIKKVKKGDSVYTSENSIFPENILIGKVVQIISNKRNSTQTLKIQLSTDFRKLQYVYVVKDALSSEKNQLEKKTKEESKMDKNN